MMMLTFCSGRPTQSERQAVPPSLTVPADKSPVRGPTARIARALARAAARERERGRERQRERKRERERERGRERERERRERERERERERGEETPIQKDVNVNIAHEVVFKVTWARVPTLISYVRSRYEPPVIPCSSSSECPGTTCCRNADGHLVNGEGQEWLGGLDPGLKNGTCSRALSGPGAACTERCGCQKGYTCYRTISGLCCPPTTCWEAEAARIDR
ncbi:hypothetical protein MAR_014954, partial [Mya arenaria]